MLRYRHARSAALLFTVALNACTIRERDSDKPAANQVVADPPPTITSAAPPAPTLPAPPPVATPAAAPVVAAPAPKPVVVAAPAPPPKVDTAAVCRKNFAHDCTISCNTKVNMSTSDVNKRRIEHDICFAECTRAANSRCGS